MIPAREIPIGTNTIVVDHISFDQAVNALLKRGFLIDKIDKQSQSCVTKFKDIPKTICHISISLHIKDGKAIVSGNWWTNINPPGKDCVSESHCIYPVTISRPLNLDVIFYEMDNFAKSLGSRITYEKR